MPFVGCISNRFDACTDCRTYFIRLLPGLHAKQSDKSKQITSTSIVVPTTTVTAVATVNSTSTTTVTTAYALPTSNFILLYPSGLDTLYGRARNLSGGVAIALEQFSADDFNFDASTHLHDVDEADEIASEPPPGLLDILFLMNTTSSTQSTPVGNVTNPGQDVWANCGGYLSLGSAADFANPPLGVSCSIIRRLFYSLSAGSGMT
ncbi:hypothetical protein B0A55_10406 [Friedmanniomyces simplex]|uniref:Uncharacterized protein n=1 Tax=Friedmanniomyces simplex TaxID=329884 RepID=A0A4U0WRW3_9PEZI|nr:hypothetical protein B0A55_10406 [Friedmanniomyces simplex]